MPPGYALAGQYGGWHVAHIKNRRKRGVAVGRRVQAAPSRIPPMRPRRPPLITTIAAIPTRGPAARARSPSRPPRVRTRSGSSASATIPKLKLLLLTGGPGLSHAYLEVMDSYLPGARASNIIITTSSRPGRATGPTIPTCGRSPATSTRSTRSARRSAATRATSACSATAGAGCWRWNMRSPTRTR